MKVIVTYTDAPLNPEVYECRDEAHAKRFANDELAWENTVKVEIPEIEFSENGDYA